MLLLLLFVLSVATAWEPAPASRKSSPAQLDNGIAELPSVDCMEDRVRLTFKTQRPFQGRIFVRGMVDKDACEQKYITNTSPSVQFELQNGACNMRRQRMIEPERRGLEMSIVIVISFHNTFITKVDRAYRCTCFYMEADKVVTSGLTVSQIPTTDLIDTARMPLCTYSVRKDSVSGPLVQFAKVGDPVFHVWQCESDMFSMLVHSCFVDDGNGQEQKPLLDEHGCAIDPIIVPDLTYNKEANLAYAEVNVFKFADKVTTYFQCAVSTCMISEGMCNGKTPPHCGPSSGLRRFKRETPRRIGSNDTTWMSSENTMDLSAQRITVLDIDEDGSDDENVEMTPHGRTAIRYPVCVATKTALLTGAACATMALLSVSILVSALLRRNQMKSVL